MAVKDSIPPLLRGIGTVLVLIAAVVAFGIARSHDSRRGGGLFGKPGAAGGAKGDDAASLAREVRELRAEVEEEGVVEEVLENRWFDSIGFIGTGVIAASFFAEAYVRGSRRQSA